jgi:hypothetical protein
MAQIQPPLQLTNVNVQPPQNPNNPATDNDVFLADDYLRTVKKLKTDPNAGHLVTDAEYVEAKTYSNLVFEQNQGVWYLSCMVVLSNLEVKMSHHYGSQML